MRSDYGSILPCASPTLPAAYRPANLSRYHLGCQHRWTLWRDCPTLAMGRCPGSFSWTRLVSVSIRTCRCPSHCATYYLCSSVPTWCTSDRTKTPGCLDNSNGTTSKKGLTSSGRQIPPSSPTLSPEPTPHCFSRDPGDCRHGCYQIRKP